MDSGSQLHGTGTGGDVLAMLEPVLVGIAVPVAPASASPSRGRFALAFSGGMDSRFLAHAAQLLGFSPLLLHVTGPHVPPEESDFARRWTAARGLSLREVPADPLSLPLVAQGSRRRCYACKRELFSRLLSDLEREARHLSLPGPLPLCDGTNASDLHAFRPGTQAAQELGIRSPLALAGLSKADIYRLASLSDLDEPEQKPRPCLLTRLPYGVRPDASLLEGLAAGERAVRAFFEEHGGPLPDFRLRLVPQEDGTQSVSAPSLCLDLHLLHADALHLSRDAEHRLARVIAKAAPALPMPVRLVPQDTLSGFFDRPRPRSDSAGQP
ncbi:tRNA(Ile)-lysidine synthetase [Mailhella sp.]|uniref:tRNA(Ile)-lysidine synthetase n=1 Tax=Mailhella sp. TaxID=1981029 RepID=UPI004063C1CD